MFDGPGPGRPKGSLNKRTIAVKEALEAAFDELGGVDGLVKWAFTDRTAFYKEWAKMLPKDVNLNATITLGELLDAVKKITPDGAKP
jgi:hypothetical protein